jgi:hypothetical protein
MTPRLLVVALLVCMAAQLATRYARADVVPPGALRLNHHFVLENARDFPDHVFVAYPVYETNDTSYPPTFKVMTYLPVGFGSATEATLYAMKRTDFAAAKPSTLGRAELEKLFRGNPKALASKIVLRSIPFLGEQARLIQLHDFIKITKLDATAFDASLTRGEWTKGDGKKLVIAYADGKRVLPEGTEWKLPKELREQNADPPAAASAPPPVTTPPATSAATPATPPAVTPPPTTSPAATTPPAPLAATAATSAPAAPASKSSGCSVGASRGGAALFVLVTALLIGARRTLARGRSRRTPYRARRSA